eukprot:TRINITY_DN576_c2_g1_i2.p1 TRINITY_DN576_c2_g1~~TRINITY_DN576_c2_g1_i2.p1  ORF type:complete len:356 (-),score=93.51 TRINITY_DN576_c2_g1_i2:464-1531(-)
MESFFNLTTSQIQKILKSEQKSNKEINKLIENERDSLQKQITLLLLGPGESGKSTVAKQLRLINSDTWTSTEREEYRQIIRSNVVKSIKSVIRASKEFGLYEELPGEYKDLIEDLETAEQLTQERALSFKKVSEHKVFVDTMSKSSEFLLHDSAPYYFEMIEKIADESYIPQDADILRSRQRTVSIIETHFQVDGYNFKVVDVGGQRSERKRWIHCFQDVTAVIFCASLISYDLCLREERSSSAWKETLTVFQEIVNNRYFFDKPIILFLNKLDLFKQKLLTSPLEKVFPEYTGSSTDDAVAFLRKKFLALNKNPEKAIYCHPTCATDTNSISTVFKIVRQLIFKSGMSNTETVL